MGWNWPSRATPDPTAPATTAPATTARADRREHAITQIIYVVWRGRRILFITFICRLSLNAAPSALDRLTLALKPDGYLVIGRYAPEPGGFDARDGSLKVMPSNSQCWESAALVDHLRKRG
jgi:hypothetical protein